MHNLKSQPPSPNASTQFTIMDERILWALVWILIFVSIGLALQIELGRDPTVPDLISTLFGYNGLLFIMQSGTLIFIMLATRKYIQCSAMLLLKSLRFSTAC